MKRAALIIPLLLLLKQAYGFTPTRAQKENFRRRWALYVNSGYAFPHAGQVSGIFGAYSGTIRYFDNPNGTTSESFDLKKASLSSGVHAAIGWSYMCSDHVGVYLGVDMNCMPTEYTLSSTTQDLTGTIITNTRKSYQAKLPVFINPAVLLQSNGSKLNLYTRLGLALPLRSKIWFREVEGYTNGPYTGGLETDAIELEAKSSFAIGYTAALGIQHYFRNIGVYIELSMLSMSLYTQEVNYTNVNINGQSGSPVSSIQFGLSSSYTNPNSLMGTQPTEAIPFSNIGLNVGLSFKL